MGLTYQQCQALGLAHLWPDNLPKSDNVEPSKAGGGRFHLAPAVKASRPDDGMNKTERAFAETLRDAFVKDLIREWRREPITLRLAGRTRYTPDFFVEDRPTPTWEPRLTFVEVKGFMRDDAAVKLKVAADMYPCFRWLLVTRAGRNGWEVREVTRNGIGTTPIHVPWIA